MRQCIDLSVLSLCLTIADSALLFLCRFQSVVYWLVVNVVAERWTSSIPTMVDESITLMFREHFFENVNVQRTMTCCGETRK
uniref:Uncharacterized protein n=1 Tax=Arundo donax TaxID=35708 RepID=A0A0A9GEP4_ARUDO